MKINHPTQDYTRWNLPEGAKARLGKGWINDIAYSPDGRLLAVGSSIGIWLYDAGTGQELDLLAKSKSNVTSVAFSPDGFTLASVTSWDEICLWDVSNGVGRTLHHYQSNYQLNSSHEYWREISSITFSPDGTTLAIGTMDFAIHLCNVVTGTHIKTLAPPEGGPRSSVLSVAFSGDGQTIASGNLGEINLWCAKTGTRKTIEERPPDLHAAIESIAFSPDSAILASGSRFAGLSGSRSKEGALRLWDAKTGTHLKTLDGHTLSINSIAFATNNNIFASGSRDGTLRLWDTKTGTCFKIITGDTSSVESVAFSPDGTTVASAYSSGKVRLWNVKTGISLKTIAGHTSSVNSVTFSPDGITVASGHHRGKIQLWDATTGKPFKTITGQTSSVNSIAFSGNSRLIVSAGDDQMVYVWNAETGELRYSLTGQIESVVFSPNSRLIVSGSADGMVRVWNTETGELKHTLKHTNKTWRNKICSLVFSPNSRLIVSGGADGTVRVWDAETGQLRHTLTGHEDTIWSVVFSPNNRLIASGSADGTVRVWDAETAELKYILTEHRRSARMYEEENNLDSSLLGFLYDGFVPMNWVRSVAFSDNSCFIASGGADGTVRVWDTETGKLRYTLTEHTDEVWSVVFSPNSHLIVSQSADETVRVWDVETGKLRRTFTEHKGSVENVSFSSDGRTLATGNRDGTVLLRDVGLLQSKTIPTKENIEFLNSEFQIQQICKERGITTLIHFTKIESLRNILHEGLIDHQSLFKKQGQQFVPNDWKRIDGHKEAICLSISFPNYPLFSKFSWSDNNGRPDYSGWIVLLLDAKVLWELDCAFCQENAASNAVRYIPLEDRKNPDALEGMFVDVCSDTKGDVYERQSMQIPNHYPTHPQAEVLVFDTIPVKYIKEVHFYNETTLEQWRYSNTGDYPPKLSVNQQYFQYGRDQVVWQDDNLDDDIPPAPPPEDDNLDDVIPF